LDAGLEGGQYPSNEERREAAGFRLFPADPRLRQAVDNRPALKKAAADDPVGVPSNTFSGAQSKAVARASIRFPPDLHKTLEEIAQQKKVLFAWVVA